MKLLGGSEKGGEGNGFIFIGNGRQERDGQLLDG